MIAWIILILLLVIYSLALPVLLKRAGQDPTLGYIPLVNFYPFLKLIKRPWWWLLLLLCPGVNLLMLVVMNVELGIAFNKRSTAEQWFFGILPWVAIPKLAYSETNQAFVGPRDWTGKKKSTAREWGEAIVFAIVAASVIRTFFIEAFTIPSPSMEKSMLVGDYLFVSKISYGAKIPQTPVSFPFVHNALPGGMTNSYLEWFSLPYFRLPGLGKVERFDPVVFNFPNGDTIVVDPEYAGHDYYSIVRNGAIGNAGNVANYLKKPDYYNSVLKRAIIQKYGIKHRPIDKKENYVKRCIGLPGDNLKIINRQVYINNAPIENPKDMMFSYNLDADEKTRKSIFNECKVNLSDRVAGKTPSFTQYEYEKIKTMSGVRSIEVDTVNTDNEMAIYPNSGRPPYSSWTRDNMGPIHIPAKGETIELTPDNIILYKRVIQAYECNQVELKGEVLYINGQAASTYTFKQNYYWMMGDNRHQSADSRYWGFVPEDHVVGKPVFTWFSKPSRDYQPADALGIRWSRMFRTVK